MKRPMQVGLEPVSKSVGFENQAVPGRISAAGQSFFCCRLPNHFCQISATIFIRARLIDYGQADDFAIVCRNNIQ